MTRFEVVRVVGIPNLETVGHAVRDTENGKVSYFGQSTAHYIANVFNHPEWGTYRPEEFSWGEPA